MKKSKLLKSFGFANLAIFMGATGIFAFAPLGASSSVASANEMVDQINTKADGENIKYAPSALGLDPKNDPVIYTTESGLEIKFGGIDVEFSLASGALTGYPYFTMGTYGGYAVNWVIIGRNSDVTALYTEIESYLFSVWKANELNTFGQYFFNSQYENLTPAGTSINQDVQTKAYVTDNETISLTKKNIVTNDEIPSGCVLVISECNLGTSVFNATASNQSTYLRTYARGSRYRYQSDNGDGNTWNNKTNGNLYTAITNLYTNGLGLTNEEKALIQPQKLITKYSAKYSNNGTSEAETITGGDILHDTYETDGNTLYHFFPLAIGWTGASENFVLSTYLKSNALKVSYVIGTKTAQAWWTRTGWYAIDSSAVNTDGSNYWGPSIGVSAVYGVRPACIIAV